MDNIKPLTAEDPVECPEQSEVITWVDKSVDGNGKIEESVV